MITLSQARYRPANHTGRVRDKAIARVPGAWPPRLRRPTPVAAKLPSLITGPPTPRRKTPLYSHTRYDPAGQLLSDGTATYSFDPNGNRDSTGYTTGSGNELTSDGTWNYSYDDAGNLIQKTNISTGEVWQYTYNNANQLTLAEHKPSSGGSVDKSVAYTYLWKWQPQTDRNSDFCGSGPPRAGRYNRHFRGLLPGQRAQRDRDGLRHCQRRLRDVILHTPGETASGTAGTQPD